MPDGATVELAVRRRRACRREEWIEQSKFAALLTRYLDPACWFTGIENRPHSLIGGMLQKKRGIKSGVADYLIVYRGRSTFLELKSRRGRLSRVQKQTRIEVLTAGATFFWARTARAALSALSGERIPFRKAWRPTELQDWEGPFSGAEKRVPTHPIVRAERAKAKRRYRLRREMRERDAAELAQRRIESDFPTSARRDAELPGTPCCAPHQRSRPGDQLPSKTKFGP
jgi:hypothetical protein